MKQDLAETRALRALAWLVSQEDLVGVFLGSTGASQDDLRAAAGDPDFLASVVDFILMDDAWVTACAEAIDLRPEDIATIRQSLPGGALPNWT